MVGEAQVFVAAFFRTIGKDVATVDEFVMETSFGQKWMSPNDSKKALALLTSAGLVEQKGGYVRPNFDVTSVELPIAYRPPKDFLTLIQVKAVPVETSSPSEDVFPKLMKIAMGVGMKGSDFVKECNAVQKKLGIGIGSAALIVLRDAGVDIGPYAEMVYRSIIGVTPS